MLVSLILLGIFISNIDIYETIEEIADANYILIVFSLLAYFIAVFFRALRWQYLLSPIKPIGLRTLYPVVVVGYMANNILPARLGEIVRAYYIGEKEKVSKLSSLATIAVERVLDGLTLLFFILMASFLLPVLEVVQGMGIESGLNWMILSTAMSLPFFVAAIVMLLAAFFPGILNSIIGYMCILFPDRIRSRLLSLVSVFIDGFSVLRYPRRLISVLILSLPVWLSESVMYYVVGKAFGIDNYFSDAEFIGVMLLVTAVSNLATAIPAAGGGIGSFEIASSVTLTILGVDGDIAAAYIIVLHIALILPVTLLGMVYLWTDRMSIGELVSYSSADTR